MGIFIPTPTGSTDPSSVHDIPSNNDNFKTRELEVRKQISEMTKASHNISSMYKETLRSVIASFNDIVTIDGDGKEKDVKVIVANPERPVAKLVQENNITLPIISVFKNITDNDQKRGRYDSVLIHEKMWSDEKQRAIRVVSFAPRPVNIKYNLNVWTKYVEDMDQILEQIRIKFNPEMNIPTKFGTLTKASLESESLLGAFNVADKEDRVIKRQLEIIVRTYIPNPRFLVTSTGRIEELNTEYTIYEK